MPVPCPLAVAWVERLGRSCSARHSWFWSQGLQISPGKTDPGVLQRANGPLHLNGAQRDPALPGRASRPARGVYCPQTVWFPDCSCPHSCKGRELAGVALSGGSPCPAAPRCPPVPKAGGAVGSQRLQSLEIRGTLGKSGLFRVAEGPGVWGLPCCSKGFAPPEALG